MDINNINKAKELQDEIQRLNSEIKYIDDNITENIVNRLIGYVLKKPININTRRTYKGFFCSEDLDVINSSIFINEREARVVIEVKKQEVKELEEEIKKL